MANVLSGRVGDALLDWAQEMSDEMRDSLHRHNHVDSAGSGNLYQACTISPEWITDEEGDAFHLKIELPFYAAYLNDGTRPSAKNPSPAFIANLSGATSWISRKGISMGLTRTFTDKLGKTRTQKFKDKAAANQSFAYAIAKHRLKFGSRGSGWFDEVWGGHPVPENSEAVMKLKKTIEKIVGNAQFIVSIIDPNQPEKTI